MEKKTVEFVYLSGSISASRDSSFEVRRRLQRALACLRGYTVEVYDRPGLYLWLKVRLLKAEVLEAMLFGCVTWSPNLFAYARLRNIHRSMLLRGFSWRKGRRKDHTLS